MMEKNKRMDNIYNFFFYIVANVIIKVNKQNADPAFSSIGFISMCFISNLMVLIFSVAKNSNVKNSSLLGLLIAIPTILLNWFFLMRNGKSENIISYYNEKYADIAYNKISLVLISLYIIFSFSSVFYLAYLLRNHLL